MSVHLEPEMRADSADVTSARASGEGEEGHRLPSLRTPASSNAVSALLAAYPELRSRFHGVWVWADVPGQNPSSPKSRWRRFTEGESCHTGESRVGGVSAGMVSLGSFHDMILSFW